MTHTISKAWEAERGAADGGRVKKVLMGFLIAVLLVAAVILGLIVWQTPPSDPRKRAEAEHGFKLPPSAAKIQCRGDAWAIAPDRGASTMFQMDSTDLPGFVSTLKVKSRNGPIRPDPGDPTINGYNVWPKVTGSYVPGNFQYGGFTQTWSGNPVPVEMLSCASPTGDWLHVEIWKLSSGQMLVKMFTDWN